MTTDNPNWIPTATVAALARECCAQTVDHDLMGEPISQADVMLMGAFGPLVVRTVNLAVERHGRADPPGTSVPVPLNEEQAALMLSLGYAWLQQHAPHRLVDDKPKPVIAYRVAWPIENSIGMRRLYSAEDWEVHQSTVEFFGGKPVALVEQHAPAPVAQKDDTQ